MLIESGNPDDRDDCDDQPLGGESSPMARAVTAGRILPLVMLKRALGKQVDRFVEEKSLCVVLLVGEEEWRKPFSTAARLLASWRNVVDADSSSRSRDRAYADAIDMLSHGARVLIVAPNATALPHFVETAADLIVEIGSIELSDVATAIEAVSGEHPKGLTRKDIAGLDLQQAIAALRPGSTAAACVRRLRVRATKVNADALVAAATPLENLRGYGEAGAWGKRLVEDLQRWRAGELDFSSIQRAAVLAGNPGVGKTSFVRSLAKSAQLPLITSSLGQLFAGGSGYLDSMCKSIDALFDSAREHGTCVIFIDELESFPNRLTLDERHATWWTTIVTHMLTSLDRALSSAAANCIVEGATNFPGRLDPALVRPERLEHVLEIGLPSVDDLSHIYRQHLGTDLQGEDLLGIATVAAGSTGADVVGHILSARAKARSAGRSLALDDLMAAICPPSRLTPDDMHRAAVHEASHAVVATPLGTGNVLSIALTGGAGAGGRVVYEMAGTAFQTAEVGRNLVMQSLAGRAGEEVVIGSVSGGAGGSNNSDLAKASGLIAAAHLSLGLGSSLVYAADPDDALAFARRSPAAMAAIEREMREIYAQLLGLIRANVEAIGALAERLLRDRVVTGDVVRQVVSEVGQRGMRHA